MPIPTQDELAKVAGTWHGPIRQEVREVINRAKLQHVDAHISEESVGYLLSQFVMIRNARLMCEQLDAPEVRASIQAEIDAQSAPTGRQPW